MQSHLESKQTTTLSSTVKNSQKHLILFFDVNGTIICSDLANGKEKEDAILQLLAENISAQWSDRTKELMTFRKYVDNYLCPGDGKIELIKKRRRALYSSLIDFLESSNHALLSEVKSEFTKISNSLNQGGDIFQSFIEMLNQLDRDKIPYTVIFRTFGQDIENIIKEIHSRTEIKIVNRAAFENGQLRLDKDTTLTTAKEILDNIKPFQHSAYQDDWKYWHAHDETFQFGKPFPVNLTDENCISIFFDDNATDKEIISVVPVSGEIQNQQAIQKELIKSGRIVPVNTIQAITDNDYFINHVKSAYKNKVSQSTFDAVYAKAQECMSTKLPLYVGAAAALVGLGVFALKAYSGTVSQSIVPKKGPSI